MNNRDILGRIAQQAVSAVSMVAARQTNDMSPEAVREAHPALTAAVTDAIVGEIANKNLAVVPTKSAWLSKINWTQALAVLAMALAYFGIDLDVKTQAAILAAIIPIQAVITWVLKTFFSNTVTPSAAAKV